MMLATAVLLVVVSQAALAADPPAAPDPPAEAAPEPSPEREPEPAATPDPAPDPAPDPLPDPAPEPAPAAPPGAPAAPPAAPPAASAPPPIWEDIHEEAQRTASGGLDVCQALSLPLSLIPGIGGAVGTVTEWLCIVPAAIALDTVALQFGGRDATLWQAVLALLAQKLFEDLIDTPLTILVAIAAAGAVGALAGSALLALYVIPGFPIFLPTLLAVGGGTLLVAPVAMLKTKGGELLFDAIFFGLTSRIYGAELTKKQEEAWIQPGDESLQKGGWARAWVLMAAAAGSKGESTLWSVVPIAGRLVKAASEREVTKRRMRRIGQDVLRDPPGRDLSGMDTAIDVIVGAKGIAAAVGQGLAVVGLAVGITGAVLPAVDVTDQPTGDTVGLVGLGIALAGLGVYAVSTTADTAKTLAVPCFYGCFE
jgi:hypothetical protein